MRKYYCSISFLMLLLSCRPIPAIEAGIYHPAKYNWLEKGWLYLTNTVYSPFQRLELKKDATFIYKGCTTEYGKWWVNQNTLTLEVEEINWTIDSFNISGFKGRCPVLPDKPYQFTIDNQRLFRKTKINTKRGERILLQEFVKL